MNQELHQRQFEGLRCLLLKMISYFLIRKNSFRFFFFLILTSLHKHKDNSNVNKIDASLCRNCKSKFVKIAIQSERRICREEISNDFIC